VLLLEYIKIYYSHIVTGIDLRYVNSFVNDPDMTISVKLANILVYTDPNDTPWTNSTAIGPPGIPIWNGKGTVMTTTCTSSFISTMNNRTFPFSYDHAVAIMEYMEF